MEWLQHHWYRLSPLHLLLYPLSLLFLVLSALRRLLYRSGMLNTIKLPVPVIVVGNITVGGTGKTPLTLWLAQQLIEAGWHPGIISRGYTPNRRAHKTPREVLPDAEADETGDEPLLMAQRGLCPVWIGHDRPTTARALLKAHPECDIILSDDGLQHYRLERDVEIIVVDGVRRFGNGLLLPAGPLREPVSRLQTADVVVINGGKPRDGEFPMQLVGTRFYNLLNPTMEVDAGFFSGMALHAIAGIGHPQRFFNHLERLGLKAENHPFPDHYCYRAADIAFQGAEAILMTEKDAVKCAPFANERCWVLRVEAQVSPVLMQYIFGKVAPYG